MYDPVYTRPPGPQYDVISTGRGMILVSQRDGSVLNPLGVDRQLVVDAAKNGSFYKNDIKSKIAGETALKVVKTMKGISKELDADQILFWDDLIGRVEKRLRWEYGIPVPAPTPTAQEVYDRALDARVKEILSQEPFKSQREQMKEDRILFDRGMSHFDALLHLKWELLPDWYRKLVKEPSAGEWNPQAWDEWMNRSRETTSLKAARDSAQRARDHLDSMHRRYMDRLQRRRKASSIMLGGSGNTEEEPRHE